MVLLYLERLIKSFQFLLLFSNGICKWCFPFLSWNNNVFIPKKKEEKINGEKKQEQQGKHQVSLIHSHSKLGKRWKYICFQNNLPVTTMFCRSKRSSNIGDRFTLIIPVGSVSRSDNQQIQHEFLCALYLLFKKIPQNFM